MDFLSSQEIEDIESGESKAVIQSLMLTIKILSRELDMRNEQINMLIKNDAKKMGNFDFKILQRKDSRLSSDSHEDSVEEIPTNEQGDRTFVDDCHSNNEAFQWNNVPIKSRNTCNQNNSVNNTFLTSNRFNALTNEELTEINCDEEVNSESRYNLNNITTRRKRGKNKKNEGKDGFDEEGFPLPLVPGTKTYSDITKKGKGKICIFSDSIARNIDRAKISRELNTPTFVKAFGGCRIAELEHYVTPTLVTNNIEKVIVQVGANHLHPNVHNKFETAEELAAGIIKIGEKCKIEGVEEIFISSLLPQRNTLARRKAYETNVILSVLCEDKGFRFINNENFTVDDLWKDGIHPIIDKENGDIGSSKLSKNYITALSDARDTY